MTYSFAFRKWTQLRHDHVDYNPITLAYEKFILLESERREVLNGDQAWPGMAASVGGSGTGAYIACSAGGGNGASVGAYVTAPDGTTTAARVGAGAFTAFFRCQGQMTGATGVDAWTAGHKWAFNWIVKAGTISYVDIEFKNGSDVTETHRFNIATGVKVSGPNTSCRIRPFLGDNGASTGWYEIYSVGLTTGASAQDFVNLFLISTAGGAQTWTAAGTENILVWWFSGEMLSSVPQQPYHPMSPTGFFGLTATGAYPQFRSSPGPDFVAVPLSTDFQTPAALTVYMEWLDRGNGLQTTAPGVFRLGDLPATAGSDGINITQSSTGFDGTYTSGGLISTSAVALVPDVGDLVSLRATLSASGALTLYAAKNGAAETTGTTGTARVLPGTWSDNFMTPNSLGTTKTGDMALRKLVLKAGVQSQATMQA